jgi:hypothetical protein
MSELRTLFYFSRIATNDGMESRFQGKSILQSVPLDAITGEADYCVATGYFGVREKCQPLIDHQIPDWVVAARPEPNPAKPSVGTSVFIPEPFEVDPADRMWAQVKLAVVANFYYALLTTKLIVHLDNEVIDTHNVAQAFDDVELLLGDLRPTDKVTERLESARTVRHADDSGQLELDGFGAVAWHIRTEGITGRRVGVARGNGMLITRQAEKLQRFPGTKPFDLFVCVVGDEGSRILRKLENPEHTEFSSDRINDPGERKRAQTAYAQFISGVRELLAELAAVEPVESMDVDDLDDFFRADFGAGTEDDRGEPNRTIRIASTKKRSHRENKPTDVPGSDRDGDAGGPDTGDEGAGGPPGGGGTGHGAGKGRGTLRTGLPVRNLRVVRQEPSTGIATVSFTPVDGSRKTLVLLKSGEAETQRLKFRTEDDMRAEAPWRDSLEFSELSPTARKQLVLEFDPADLEFAIEGRLIR